MLSQRNDLRDVLDAIVEGRLLPGDVTGHWKRPSTAAEVRPLPAQLHPGLAKALNARGFTSLYTHQAAAFDLVSAGKNVVLTTPTASGKTLAYNLPVLDTMLREPETRALYLFPTKALSQDQYAGLHELLRAADAPIRTFTFDGDTPPDARRAVREHGHLVITNPDMLHSGVLPQHTKWLKLFRNLRYVVIDELHTYRGIFGSHVANLLRRLRRICNFHGSDPQFICCSATIANPVELAESLVGVDFELVGESGAPRSEHHVVAYNPPVVNAELGIRAGAVRATFEVARELILSGVPTIVFARSRLHVEIILKYLREAMVTARQDPALVQGYRGGYLPTRRRRIERGLRAGTIRGVVSTNALELGIDIGSLQACVMAGFPGSIASFQQQSGRAGRRAGVSLTVYVASSRATDQYLVQHPEVLRGSSPERARLNPKNLFVMVDHAKCATFELPLEDREALGVLDPDETEEVMEYLQTHGVVHRTGTRFHWMARVFPAHHVNLRGIPEQNFAVIELPRDEVIAEVDFRSAHTSLHTHAIYNLDGRQYQVERLDYENHKAYVRKVDPDYYTTAMTYHRVGVLDEEQVTPYSPFAIAHGEVVVTRKFVGFKKIRFHTNETIGFGEIHLPDLEMHTTAIWFSLPASVTTALDHPQDIVVDGLRALAHALKTAACIDLMCTERDLGHAVSEQGDGARAMTTEAPSASVYEPTVYVYDTMPGGVGLSNELHARFVPIAERARSLMTGCRCEHGCPACLGEMPAYRVGPRAAGIAIVDRLLSAALAPAPALAVGFQ